MPMGFAGNLCPCSGHWPLCGWVLLVPVCLHPFPLFRMLDVAIQLDPVRKSIQTQNTACCKKLFTVNSRSPKINFGI